MRKFQLGLAACAPVDFDCAGMEAIIEFRRGGKRSVIGIPKTIDNDIMYLDKSFGFDTAFAEAVKVASCAHVEALGAVNGIGLMKLMGRHSGFISCYAATPSGAYRRRRRITFTACDWPRTRFTRVWLAKQVC